MEIQVVCCFLFLTFSVLVANTKKLLYTVANPARGLLNREKERCFISVKAKERRYGTVYCTVHDDRSTVTVTNCQLEGAKSKMGLQLPFYIISR